MPIFHTFTLSNGMKITKVLEGNNEFIEFIKTLPIATEQIQRTILHIQSLTFNPCEPYYWFFEAMEIATIRFAPDYRNLGNYQFVTGWTGGGAEMCVHLTFEEISKRLRAKHGDGRLVDDGTDLIWMQPIDTGLPKLVDQSLVCSEL